MARRIAFKVHGLVQGVSYRYFACNRAEECSVTGWVRNTSGGHVQGEAQGSQEALASFCGHLQKGPSHSVVAKVEKEDIAVVEGEKGFHVRA